MANSLMSRAFTTREKVMILILAILLIGVGYYFLVVKQTVEIRERNAAQLAEVQMQIDAQTAVLASNRSMEAQLEALGNRTELSVVASYDNVGNEVNALNAIMAKTTSYNLSFGQPELSNNLVRRTVSMSFTTGTVDEAMNLVMELQDCPYRCEITDFSLSASLQADGSVKSVTTTAKVTFFETMEGATSYSGLVEKKS